MSWAWPAVVQLLVFSAFAELANILFFLFHHSDLFDFCVFTMMHELDASRTFYAFELGRQYASRTFYVFVLGSHSASRTFYAFELGSHYASRTFYAFFVILRSTSGLRVKFRRQ